MVKNTKKIVEIPEIWKEVDNFPNYHISNKGNVKNIVTGKFLKLSPSHKGYISVILTAQANNRKNLLVHRLVASAFLPTPLENEVTVDHINRIKHDNRVENLKWATSSEQNYNKKTYTKNTKKVQQYDLEGNYIKTYNSAKEASEDINGDTCTIRQVCQGRYRSSGGYFWKYENEQKIVGEIWKNVVLDGLNFEVSNKGRVKHVSGVTTEGFDYSGYKAVQRSIIGRKPKTFVIHRLVAFAFIPNDDKTKDIVNHKDGNKKNNNLENLEWVSRSENTLHSVYSLENKAKKIIQRDAYTLEIVKEFPSIKICSKETGISTSSIIACSKGKMNFSSGFIFEYKDESSSDVILPPTFFLKYCDGKYINCYEEKVECKENEFLIEIPRKSICLFLSKQISEIRQSTKK